MNTPDVTNARSPDRSPDHVVNVTTSRRKKTPTRDIVEIVSKFMNYQTVCNVSTTESSLEDAPTVEQSDQTVLSGSTLALERDEEFKEIMMPILEARKIKVSEQNKKFTTYKNCPLCRGYFHSAKACIFRTHVKHFNLLQKQMDQYSEEVNTTVKMVIPTIDSDTDSEEEEEEDSDESEEEDCGTYMMIIHHGDSSEEENMEEDEDSFASKLKHVTKFDKILTIVAKQKKEDQPDDQTEDEEDEEDSR